MWRDWLTHDGASRFFIRECRLLWMMAFQPGLGVASHTFEPRE
jgi:hypothetical protein